MIWAWVVPSCAVMDTAGNLPEECRVDSFTILAFCDACRRKVSVLRRRQAGSQRQFLLDVSLRTAHRGHSGSVERFAGEADDRGAMNARWITPAAVAALCCTLAVPAHAGKCTGRLTPEEHVACQARRAAQPSSPTETTRDAERRFQEQKRKQQSAERERD